VRLDILLVGIIFASAILFVSLNQIGKDIDTYQEKNPGLYYKEVDRGLFESVGVKLGGSNFSSGDAVADGPNKLKTEFEGDLNNPVKQGEIEGNLLLAGYKASKRTFETGGVIGNFTNVVAVNIGFVDPILLSAIKTGFYVLLSFAIIYLLFRILPRVF